MNVISMAEKLKKSHKNFLVAFELKGLFSFNLALNIYSPSIMAEIKLIKPLLGDSWIIQFESFFKKLGDITATASPEE